MIGVHVRLDARAERVTVHLGHHHVADHHIGHLCQNHGQCLLTVGECLHGIVALQFRAQIFGNLVVVFHHHHIQVLAVLYHGIHVGLRCLHDALQLVLRFLVLLTLQDHLLGFQMTVS